MKYNFIKNYKNNDELRNSFFELALKTYSLDFQDWYNKGYWGEQYIPYSIEDNGKVIANVSVNLMDFVIDDSKKRFIQLGTVMTDKEYRGQGLSRFLMERILEEYKDTSDGIYLFANDKVLDFYPKFGFTKSEEYQYSKRVDATDFKKRIQAVSMKDKENRDKFMEVAKNSVSNERLTMVNLGLLGFYITGFLSDSVYYLSEVNAYVIAEIEEETLLIHHIIAQQKVNLDNVIESFGSGFNKVVLGFAPYEDNGYDIKEKNEEDCTLFILGEELKKIEMKKLIFPTLSHA